MPRFADPLLKAAAYFLLANDACVPLRTCWCKRLPIRVQQFDKNPALPIGPPAWHLNRSVRYLLMEVEAFERKARVTCPPHRTPVVRILPHGTRRRHRANDAEAA